MGHAALVVSHGFFSGRTALLSRPRRVGRPGLPEDHRLSDVPGRRGSGRAWAPATAWEVPLHDQLPAYISWQEYQANQERLRDNSKKYGRGVPLGGGSL